MMTSPADWARLHEGDSTGGTGEFHAFYLSATLADETSFDFTFDQSTQIDAVVTAYVNASSSRVIDSAIVIEPALGTFLAVEAAEAAEGSLNWIGTAGTLPLQTKPTNVTTVSSAQNIAIFNAPVDGAVPEITITPPQSPNAIVSAVQILLEP